MSSLEWILIVAAGLVAPFVLLMLVGLLVPSKHEFSRSILVKQSPQTVWNAITNMERVPSWWPPCSQVERIDDRDGRPVYRQTFQEGRRQQSMVLEVIEFKQPDRFVTRVADERSPFQGSWIYDLKPEAGGARVSLTEHGEIRRPIVRTMFRLMINKSKFVDSFLVSLGRKFGEEVTPA